MTLKEYVDKYGRIYIHSTEREFMSDGKERVRGKTKARDIMEWGIF